MKDQLRGINALALTILITTSAFTSLAQQRQPAPDERVRVEHQRTMQGPEGATPHPDLDRVMAEHDAIAHGGSPAHGDFIFLATEMSFGGKLVKGAPYSAQAVTESSQTLPDGNRIINKTTATIYRDSEGRTRREQTLKALGRMKNGGEPAQTIFISDPVAGTSYSLDPRTQVARKMPPMRFKMRSPKPAGDGAKGVGTTEPQVHYRVRTQQSPKEPLKEKELLKEKEKFEIALESDVLKDKRMMESGVAMGWLDKRNPSARSEALGKQNINGVEAEGTRNTVTIPAGEIGNERAIEIVSERWYSPELQVIVMTRHTDPRFGENTYQLTNINRSEPARELFEVPSGYTIQENTPLPMRGTGSGTGSGINGGVLNGKAITLPKPQYPEIARQAKASGSVTVNIMIDEEGNVISAESVSGHPLLRSSAVEAARQARFSPTKLSGQPVKVSGVLVYQFGAQ